MGSQGERQEQKKRRGAKQRLDHDVPFRIGFEPDSTVGLDGGRMTLVTKKVVRMKE